MRKFWKSYSGYIREAIIYVTFPLLPKRNSVKKFFIFSVGRAGSNLLVSLLDTHPLIRCHSEVLGKKVVLPKSYLRCNELIARKDVFGFKLLLYNFKVQKINNPKGFVTSLYDEGYKIISLQRCNILRQSISHIYAKHRQKFHHSDTQRKQYYKKLTISLETLQEELLLFAELRKLEQQILIDLPFLRLTYEEDLEDKKRHQSTVNRISDFIKIQSAHIHTNLVKTTPYDLSSFIENYGEFREYIYQTEYAEFLD